MCSQSRAKVPATYLTMPAMPPEKIKKKKKDKKAKGPPLEDVAEEPADEKSTTLSPSSTVSSGVSTKPILALF